MTLLMPLHYETLSVMNTFGRFVVVRVGLRYHVRQRGSDDLYRWVGPKPMWSRMQVERVAQALLGAANEAWDEGKRYGRELRSLAA